MSTNAFPPDLGPQPGQSETEYDLLVHHMKAVNAEWFISNGEELEGVSQAVRNAVDVHSLKAAAFEADLLACALREHLDKNEKAF